jgi:tetratricopeptide (TPR) repeat protein
MAAAYARAGRPDRARGVLARYAAEVRDTMRQRIDAPARNRALAEIALAEHRFPDALELFRRGDQLPDGPENECVPCFLITVARAFDAAGQADSAIVYLARYQTTPSAYRLGGAGPEVDATFRAWSHRRLGELYEQRGDKQRAAQQYTQFVNLWKDADPELQSRVAEVRRRLRRIGDVERQ